MKLNIPFVYMATVVKPKCRNTTDVLIEDSIEVEVKNYDSLPIAFKVGSLDYYWDNKSLWTIVSKYKKDSNTDTLITLEQLKENTENPHEDLGIHSTESPFYKFSKYGLDYNYSYRTINTKYSSKDDAVNQNREYIRDNKDEVISKIKDIAKSIAFINGLLYQRTGEPRYKIDIYGYNGNKSLSVENSFNPNCSLSNYYSALEYDMFKKDFEADYFINKNKIEVLINEAVQIDMTKEIKELRIYSNDIKLIDLLNMTKDDFLNLISKHYFEQYNRKIKVIDFEGAFIEHGFHITIINSERVA